MTANRLSLIDDNRRVVKSDEVILKRDQCQLPDEQLPAERFTLTLLFNGVR